MVVLYVISHLQPLAVEVYLGREQEVFHKDYDFLLFSRR